MKQTKRKTLSQKFTKLEKQQLIEVKGGLRDGYPEGSMAGLRDGYPDSALGE